MQTTTTRTLTVAILIAATACGGGDDDDADSATQPAEQPAGASGDDAADDVETGDVDTGDDAGGSGDVVDPQPPGQALVSVDGREFTLTEPGGLACAVATDAITFSFRIGDNEITLGGGGNQTDGQWLGGLDLRIGNPDGEPGPIAYFPELPKHSDGMAVNGDSFSYSGPMLKQLPNDGTNPLPVDVGDGIVTLTCP